MLSNTLPLTNSQAGACAEPEKDQAAKKAKILVIEDDAGVRRLLRYCLERSGYDVLEAATGDQGVDLASRYHANAVLLDTTLPDMNGLTVLNRLREWSQTPVLMLSDNSQEEEKIAALDGGANDYIVKPFGTGELLARLRVTQRYTSQTEPPKVFSSGDLTVDLASRSVSVKGKPARLTPIEYSLLRLFIQNAGKVLTHRQIFMAVWGTGEMDKVHYIRVYLHSLRHKLARELIVTEPGIGYRLAAAGGC